jgi:peptide/nickel transport system substrate-binding protein
MEAGELEYWWIPPADQVARMEKNPNMQVFISDPAGIQGWLRPNHLHAPFNNKKARQALLYLVDQELWLQAAVGQPKFYRTCPSYFMCGNMPYETSVGAPRPDLERAKQLLKEGGYDGRPLVLLDPTDRPEMHGACLVLKAQLERIGAKVELAALDWSTVIARRAKKDPPASGGWNLMHATWISPDVNNPAVNIGLSGACDKAWFGWSCSEQMEKLRGDWLRATDAGERKKIAEQVQLLAYDEVPYLPWGQYLAPSLYRKQVKGVLNFPAAVLWNVWLEA